MMRRALTTILPCLSLVALTACDQGGNSIGSVGRIRSIGSVERIRIDSRWIGLGDKKQGEIVATRKSGAYLANGEKIPDELIANLLSAIDAPVVTKPNLANLGITQEWLDANAEVAIEAYVNIRNPSIAPNQRALHLSSLKNLKIIEKVLLRSFNSVRTDDYPSVEIEITETDGRAIKVSSKAQHLFMLPWTISSDGKESKTYNADIARAVASLTPKDFANKERLAGACSDPKLFGITSAASRVAPNYFADKERLAGACLAFELADMVAYEIKGR